MGCIPPTCDTMNKNLPWIASALLLASVFGFPAVAAQYGIFGTQVKVGDADSVPLTKADGIALKVNEADFGNTGMARDNCLLLDTGSTAAAGAHIKDIRLTACNGKNAGTLIETADNLETSNPYPNAVVTVQYADINGNGKYDKADPVYITTAAAGTLAATGATGMWTLRMSPTAGGAPGTFVLPADKDFVQYRSMTKAWTDGPAVVEREDKQYYMTPRAVGAATVSKSIPRGSVVPADSIRLGGPAADVSDVKPVVVTVLTANPTGGTELSLGVQVLNAGKASGVGLVVTKIEGVLLDARLTPVLSPTETATILVTVKAPSRTGLVELRVNDVFQVLELAAPTGGFPAATVEDMRDHIAQLEARLVALEGAEGVVVAGQAQANGLPGLDVLPTLAIVGLAFVVLRRRGAA